MKLNFVYQFPLLTDVLRFPFFLTGGWAMVWGSKKCGQIVLWERAGSILCFPVVFWWEAEWEFFLKENRERERERERETEEREKFYFSLILRGVADYILRVFWNKIKSNPRKIILKKGMNLRYRLITFYVGWTHEWVKRWLKKFFSKCK